MSTTTKTISKSTKDRRPASYSKQKGEMIIRKEGMPDAWKQIVDIWEVGKNRKGKKIYKSQTKHIRA